MVARATRRSMRGDAECRGSIRVMAIAWVGRFGRGDASGRSSLLRPIRLLESPPRGSIGGGRSFGSPGRLISEVAVETQVSRPGGRDRHEADVDEPLGRA